MADVVATKPKFDGCFIVKNRETGFVKMDIPFEQYSERTQAAILREMPDAQKQELGL